MKRCKNCINDESVRRISFDENGVCCYCNNFERIRSTVENRAFMERLFEERIEKVRGKFDYDVAMGISGGKDSVFVLYELINKYGLKVKTFTMDNGFLSETARQNVDRLVSDFGVEHEYIEFDKDLLKRFYKYSMKKWLTPCVACSYIGYASMINYTSKINAGMCIHGRSPQQMFRYYGDDVFTALIDAGLKHPDEVNIDELYNGLLGSIENNVDKKLMADVKKILFGDADARGFREFAAYFLYHPYDEKEIVEFLKANTSWKPKKEYDHYDCKVHNAAHYIYQCAEGRPHILPEVSCLMRLGQVDEEGAYALVKEKVYTEKPIDEIKKLCDFVSLKPYIILTKAKLYNKFVKK